jgi:DENN domain-containing protein
VYWTTALAQHTLVSAPSPAPNPLFYVNVNDIDSLAEQSGFVAATTEKVP